MEIVWIVIGLILCLVGFIGSVIPVLPGPPFNYLAILILYFSNETSFTFDNLAFWLILTVVVVALDYIVPILGAKKMGGSRYGVWGTAIGLLLGLIFFPPLGLIIGPIVGALVGETIAGKSGTEAIKAALGSFLGFLAGTFLKLITSGILTYYFISEIFDIYYT